MFGMYVAPKSSVTARAILSATIRHYSLDHEQPTLDRAVIIADDLMRKHGLYVRADYLLDVWTECHEQC